VKSFGRASSFAVSPARFASHAALATRQLSPAPSLARQDLDGPPHLFDSERSLREEDATTDGVEDEYLSFTDDLEPHPRPSLILTHYEPIALRPIPRITDNPESEEAKNANVRADWLDLLGTTSSLEEAWQAYNTLSSLSEELFPLIQPKNDCPPLQIPHRYLHRLSMMLGSAQPPTRETFLRLHAVLSTLHNTGGTLAVWQWNALIHAAGTGTRKLRPADAQRALDVFTDMVQRLPPGTTLAQGHRSDDPDCDPPPTSVSPETNHVIGPDIVTYTTLLNLAVRTGHPSMIEHVRSLLTKSGLKPTVVTHRVLLRHFTRTGDMDGVRDTLSRIRAQGLELGREGVNAAAWAFAYNNHLDVADAIYRVMRSSLPLDKGSNEQDTEANFTPETTRQYLEEHERIVIPEGLVPDATTYTLLIQAFTYHGRLVPALRIFHDMLTTPDREVVFRHASKELSRRDVDEVKTDRTVPVPAHAGPTKPEPVPLFEPIYPVYRALFLGFSKNAVPHRSAHGSRPLGSDGGRIALFPRPPRLSALQLAAARKEGWTHDLLYAVFKSFMALPQDTRPSERVVYWILRAFERATDGDIRKLRKVYVALEKRFGGGWGGRLGRARDLLFPGEQRR
jgi:hypothetical protein